MRSYIDLDLEQVLLAFSTVSNSYLDLITVVCESKQYGDGGYILLRFVS